MSSCSRGETRRARTNTLVTNIPAVPPPITVSDVRNDISSTYNEFNPRVGLKWTLSERQTLRLVGQKWRRPASAATLAPIDTLGVALNDRLVMAGGLYQRTRLQYDAELNASTFAQAFVDHEQINNGLGGARTAITDFEVTQLASLRNRQDVFTAKPDVERTPIFGTGTVRTVGMAVNHRLSRDHTVSLRYLYRDSEQGCSTDIGVTRQCANAGLAVPYIPRHYLLAGSQWALPGRLLFGMNAAYRSIRFRDDINQNAIQHGWNYGLSVYWESEDKRLSLQAILDNLLSRTNAGDLTDAHLVLRAGYRF